MSQKHFALIVLCLVVTALLALPVHNAAAAPSTQHGTMYVVRFGDTLFSIGRMYGVSPWAIAQANGLVNPNYIRGGQILMIPGMGGGHMHQPQHPGHGCYLVMPGDTLFRIGMHHGVSPWAIAQANGLMNPNYIRAGQCLIIPGH